MRVLLVGYGSIGRRHAKLLQGTDEVGDMLAYRSGSDSAHIEGIREVYDFQEALSADPDVAFVTNPTGMHVETAVRCAKVGCDLFIEKPLSHAMDGVDRLCEVVKEKDLVTMMGCQLRFDPILQTVERRLADGAVGDVRSFDAVAGSYLPDWRPERDYRETYSASVKLGGGVVLDLIHELDYVDWLFGEIATTRAIVDRVSDLDIETEDIAEIACRTTQGTVGRIHLDYFRRPRRRDLEVVGSEGVLRADLEGKTLSLTNPTGTDRESFEYEPDERLRRQLDQFFEHVKTRESPENDVGTGKRVLQTALDVKEDFNAAG